jgi:integrase/recombinase XerD
MITYNVELNRKPRKNGLHLISLRLTDHRVHRRIPLNVFIGKNHFNKSAKYGSWIRKSCYEYKVINEQIVSTINELKLKENEFIKSGTKPSLSQVINDMRSQSNYSLIEFARTEISRHRNHQQFRTAVKKGHLVSKLIEFSGETDLQFKAITVTFLRGYENYWITRGNKINTIQTDLKGLRSIIRSAILEGLITSDQNPFERYRIKSEKTSRDKLDDLEIKALSELTLAPGSHKWHSRNMFLLAFYFAGMRFGDILQLKWKNIKEDHICYTMDKTRDPHKILLVQEARDIIQKYQFPNMRPDHFVLPFFKNHVDYSDQEFLTNQISSKNALVNKYLKQIAREAGISKNISFHISRHSFAYRAIIRSNGDIYGLAKSLNHKDINTTQIYLKHTDSDAVDNIMRTAFKH